MIDIVLPTKHSVANPATNQINSAVFAIRRMRGPNRIAASPIIEKRTVRAPKTIASRRIFAFEGTRLMDVRCDDEMLLMFTTDLEGTDQIRRRRGGPNSPVLQFPAARTKSDTKSVILD